MHIIDQAVECLARYDKNHKEFYEKNRDRIETFIKDSGILNFICTGFAGLRPRADLYIRTERRIVYWKVQRGRSGNPQRA